VNEQPTQAERGPVSACGGAWKNVGRDGANPGSIRLPHCGPADPPLVIGSKVTVTAKGRSCILQAITMDR